MRLSSFSPIQAFYRQRGIALLTVLFILVLLSTLAVYTVEDENIAIRRAENQRDMAQGLQVAMAGELWLAKALERDLLSAPQGVDYLGDEWAQLDSSVVKVEDGQMIVQAADESGKFNLNNLLDGKEMQIPDPDPNAPTGATITVFKPWYGYFIRLLGNLGLEEELADAVLDWVDADSKREDNGAEDSQYLSADPPYVAANQPFFSISGLSLVEGFDSDIISILSPNITALPVDPKNKQYTKININTAPEAVLRSLDETPADALLTENMLKSRDVTPFAHADTLYSQWSMSLRKEDFNAIAGVSSNYFSVQSCARFGRVNVALQSLLYRKGPNDEVAVISRQRRYNCEVKITQ